MKLLVDQNISWRVIRLIADAFPESAHVDEFGLGAETPDARRDDIEAFEAAADVAVLVVTAATPG
ncbi:MAG: DUF5615 family PIN-like protein [Ilumatobacteraceae bacterium]